MWARINSRLIGSLLLVLCIAAAPSLGCGGGCASESTVDGGPASPTQLDEGEAKALDIIDVLPHCDIDHRGLALDFGTDALIGRYGYDVESPKGIVPSQHDGASWARIYERKIKLRFMLPRPSRVFVSARAIGHDSTRVNASIDGYLLGTLRLKRNAINTPRTRPSGLALDAGLHTLQLHFRGYKRSDADPFAEIDWLRIGAPDDEERTYGAPALSDILLPGAQLSGVPHEAIGMLAPASIRCVMRVPPHARFKVAVGMLGAGQGMAAFTVRRDSEEPSVLERIEVKGGNEASWGDVDVSLHPFAGQVVTLELGVRRTSGTGRLLFGDPQVVVPKRAEPTPKRAQSVVVVVLDGVERSDLPPWRGSETPHLPVLSMLAKNSTVFDNHRAPSSLVAASMASLISGLAPWDHTLADQGARLPESVVTIGKIARDSSVRAAMFSGVPTTFEPFGFGAHWELFQAYPANSGRAATAPIDDALKWLAESGSGAEARPMLALIHARGGHPPWDVTPPEARKLPPAQYTGYLSPRRAAQQLADLAGRQSRLSDSDHERMRALYFVGLAGQDEAIGKLIAKLRELERWDSTLFIVTGSVASARSTLFQDGATLSEDLLTLPLYVHFPQQSGGRRVERTTEMYDITQTALRSLELRPAPEMRGNHLRILADDVGDKPRAIRVAVTDQSYSLRWGAYVLRGARSKRARLCQVELDPTCAYDRTHTHPTVAHHMFRRLAEMFAKRGQVPTREPLTLDSDTAGMLKVWGAY